ncbi:MAG: DNA repair protein RecO [Acidobacteriota bacterium]
MSLVETESLILKSYNLAEADRIVVLLTHDHGVVRGVAKGAKRLLSKFGSGLESFTTVRATYFQKESRELVSIEKVELVRSFFRSASDPDFLNKFSYLSDILIAFSPPHDPNETLYRMVKACLQTADERPDGLLAIGVYFELWLLQLSGYLPDWSRCDECGRVFEPAEDASVQVNFHLLCSGCRRASGGRTMSGVHREIFTSARRLSPDNFAGAFTARAAELSELSIILKRIISQALGREITDERVAAGYNTI